MKILFVNKDNPFGVGGGDFATHAYLLAFSELCNGNIDVYLRDGIKTNDSIKANFIIVPERSIFAVHRPFAPQRQCRQETVGRRSQIRLLCIQQQQDFNRPHQASQGLGNQDHYYSSQC